MRISELLNITKIDKHDNIYYFNITDGKTDNSIRQVPLNNNLLNVKNYIESMLQFFPRKPDESDINFKNRTHKLVLRQFKKIINIDNKVVHSIRHTVSYKLINVDDNISLVQDVLGHSKSDKDSLTIDVYAGGYSLYNKLMLLNKIKY